MQVDILDYFIKHGVNAEGKLDRAQFEAFCKARVDADAARFDKFKQAVIDQHVGKKVVEN